MTNLSNRLANPSPKQARIPDSCFHSDIETVGIHDNSLDFGGHSLVTSRVIHAFQLELPFNALFDAPTVAETAVIFTQHQAKRASDDDVAEWLREC
jgi:hypothetical protein